MQMSIRALDSHLQLELHQGFFILFFFFFFPCRSRRIAKKKIPLQKKTLAWAKISKRKKEKVFLGGKRGKEIETDIVHWKGETPSCQAGSQKRANLLQQHLEACCNDQENSAKKGFIQAFNYLAGLQTRMRSYSRCSG